MVMLPVAMVHVGCTFVAVGAAGAVGTGLMALVEDAVHPAVFFTVIVYVTPAVRLLNVTDG